MRMPCNPGGRGWKPTLALCALPHRRKISRQWTKLISTSLFNGMPSHIIAFDAIVYVLKIKLHCAILVHCFLFTLTKVFLCFLMDNVLTTEGSQDGIFTNMHKLLNYVAWAAASRSNTSSSFSQKMTISILSVAISLITTLWHASLMTSTLGNVTATAHSGWLKSFDFHRFLYCDTLRQKLVSGWLPFFLT